MWKNCAKCVAITYMALICIFILFKKFNHLPAGKLSFTDDVIPWNKSVLQSRKSMDVNTYPQIPPFDEFSMNMEIQMRMPMIYYYLPHLNNDFNNVKPITAKTSTWRRNAWLVMGITTVYRKNADYLTVTIESLISNLRPHQQQQCLILVCVTEFEEESYYLQVSSTLKDKFSEYLESGLLQIIASPKSFYPNLTYPVPLFGDSLKRAKWRRKQNLDYVYLMMLALSRGKYYMQLEDDIIASDNYFEEIYNYVSKMMSSDWLLINFAKLGFIGKFFRTTTLIYILEFILMFYKEKPCDWLLLNFIEAMTCDGYHSEINCIEQKKLLSQFYNKPLFQHMGKYSSLEGKIQNLKERNFSPSKSEFKNFKFFHFNPSAVINTSIETYSGSIEGLYNGLEEVFWGKNPKAGDVICVYFHKPTRIYQYIFESGTAEHPGDRLYHTDLQILTHEADIIIKNLRKSEWINNHKVEGQLVVSIQGETHVLDSEGFYTINQISEKSGKLVGKLKKSIGLIKGIRLKVKKDSPSWIILTKIKIIEAKNQSDFQ